MATPNRSASFSTIIAAILARIRTVDANGTRLIVAPNPEFAPYRAEAGTHVVVYPPQPHSTGGGRCGTRVKRDLVIHVVTESLLDAAGNDELLTLAHLDREDAILDVVVDGKPSAANVGPEVNTTWKPGAVPAHRLMKSDAGLVVSALQFEVLYAQPHTIPA